MSDKPSIARDSTMVVTAKQAKQILGNEAGKLGDTRAVTNVIKKSKKANVNRASTIQKAVEEAKAFIGKEVNVSGARQLRVRKNPPPKPVPKRAGTMQKTAKEGKAFLKKQQQKKVE